MASATGGAATASSAIEAGWPGMTGGTGGAMGAGRASATSSGCVAITARSGEGFAPVCIDEVTKRVNTSNAAATEAAAVCARSMGGKALEGLLLPQAETTSLTAWWSSSVVR